MVKQGELMKETMEKRENTARGGGEEKKKRQSALPRWGKKKKAVPDGTFKLNLKMLMYLCGTF